MNDPKPLELGLVTMVSVFHQYADGSGKDASLKKEAFKKLLAEQMPMAGEIGPDACEVFSKLDMDGSGSVDFPEYCTMICGMAMGLHMMLGDMMKK